MKRRMTVRVGRPMGIAAGLVVGVVVVGSSAAQSQTANWSTIETLGGAAAAAAIIDANAAITQTAEGAVAASVIVDQQLIGNVVVEQGIGRSVAFVNSGNAHDGIVGVNQSAGEVNNQANVVAVAYGTDTGEVAYASVGGAQTLLDNTLTVRDSGPRDARIVDSFNNAAGIAGINQAAGSLNQQANVVAMAWGVAALPGTFQLNETDLETVGTADDNTLIEEGTPAPRTALIENSFQNFVGIAQASQTVGDFNRTANVTTITVMTVGAP